MGRAILMVMDSVGCGGAPDAGEFGDQGADTLGHIARACAEAGIAESELSAAEEATENLAYTRYVLEAGYSGDFLDLLAALAPCVLGYGEIGLRLAAGAAPGTPYRDWIDAYAAADYQQTCREVGALIDGAVAARLGDAARTLPRWGELAARFETATRLEAAFWGLGRA